MTKTRLIEYVKQQIRIANLIIERTDDQYEKGFRDALKVILKHLQELEEGEDG